MVGKICEAKKVIYYVFRHKKIPFQEKLERDFSFLTKKSTQKLSVHIYLNLGF